MTTIESRFLGTDGSRYARFEAISDEPLSLGDLSSVQNKHGYNPAGYGAAWKESEKKNDDGKFVTVLACMGSCD